MKVTLYRLFDADDALMYVGVTGDFFQRLYQHRITLRFGRVKVARWELEEYPTRDDALEAEAAAILHEHPSFNRSIDFTVLRCECDRCAEAKALRRGVPVEIAS